MGLGKVTGSDTAFSDGFICSVHAVLGSRGVTSCPYEEISILCLQFLYVLCVIVILVLEKKKWGKHIVPVGKSCQCFHLLLLK